jgi:hypothetical protein
MSDDTTFEKEISGLGRQELIDLVILIRKERDALLEEVEQLRRGRSSQRPETD